MDALYFRVSSNKQTSENQFEDLLQVAERDDSERDWAKIRQLLAECIYEEERPTSKGGIRVVYHVRPEVVEELAKEYIYVEHRSGKVGAKRRPLFEQMKQDAALRKFDRLLVWKVTRLGRGMREVISTVYELADLDITTMPVRSQTGPITSSMGRLLWAIAAWYAEAENEERSETIKAGLERARKEGKELGRQRKVFDRVKVVRLRDAGLSWREIARRSSVSVRTVRRIYEVHQAASEVAKTMVAPADNRLAQEGGSDA